LGAATQFRPPFNRLSRFRDPGRVNINTISDRLVWEGIVKGLQWDSGFNLGASWNELQASRRGYPLGSLDSRFPTQFANPIRSSNSSKLAPIDQVPMRVEGVEATLLRSRDPSSPSAPLFDFGSNNEYNNTGKNPYFRYQAMMRLPNLVTTHSNVFAIWITVGYFELDGNGKLAAEAGSLTGDIKRHRMFAIVDRSIPVAYQQPVAGQPVANHNVDRMILIKRMLD
jgi:hypothetical protein